MHPYARKGYQLRPRGVRWPRIGRGIGSRYRRALYQDLVEERGWMVEEMEALVRVEEVRLNYVCYVLPYERGTAEGPWTYRS
tara:strand:- start:1238 stop:1483 length:246 start_codon:yes stop_codon:yes gene_type:complete